MSVAVIADAHLGGPGGEAGPLVEQLAALPGQGCTRLLLLGDLFHSWVGSPKFESPEVAAVVPVLRGLRQQGLELDYVEGNRDFFLEGSLYADCFDRLAREVAFEADGVRYLAVHGDGLNDRDWRYRFWRRLSKSALTRLLFLKFPAPWIRRIGESTERRLSRTNFKHKLAIPEAVIRRYGERRLREGHDVLLLGHFHEARRWRVDGGEVRLLEAWFRTRRVEWLA